MGNKYVLNTMYLKARWEKDPNATPGQFGMKKIADDILLMVIKDSDEKYSKIEIIEKPTIEWYSVKDPNTVPPYNEMMLDRDLVDVHVCEYSKRDIEICKYLGIEKEYDILKRRQYNDENGRTDFNRFMNEKIYKNPLIYGADMDIEDFYKTKFIEEHGSDLPQNLNISYMDIETDIYTNATEDIDQNNPKGEIIVITYFNNISMEYYALLLHREEVIPVQKEIISDPNKYLKDWILEDYTEDPDIDFHLEWYDDERMLIQRWADLVHRDKPEFCLAWNSNYDYKYIMNRAKLLGMNVVELFCHPDVPQEYHILKYQEDADRKKQTFANNKKKTIKQFSRMWDWVIAPGYTCFLDQMSLYSNLRKRSIEKSYKLDFITEKELKIHKVDLHSFGLTIRNGPFKNYKIFLKYSIRDTFLLYKLENKLKDIRSFITLCDNTKLEKGMNVSFVIKNAFFSMFRRNNQVIGNTIDYGVSESIDGAIVGDPKLCDSCPVEIDGKKTQIYKSVIDFDAKSLYPSTMRQFRIGKNSAFTRITHVIDEYGKYIMSGADYNQMLQVKDVAIIHLCHELYGLPLIDDVLGMLESKLMNNN